MNGRIGNGPNRRPVRGLQGGDGPLRQFLSLGAFMGRDRKSNWGVMAVVAAALFAALAYWILSANEAPTLPYALAQYVLLGSVLVGMVDFFAKCRPAR